MPIEPRIAENEDAFTKLVLALVGIYKSGKSVLASTARKPILFIDTDKRFQAVAGKQGVYGLTFHEPAYPNMPTVFSEILDLTSQLERSRKLSDIVLFKDGTPYKPFENIHEEVKTIVNDSIQTIAKAAMAYNLYSNKELRYSVNIGGKFECYTPKNWAAWGAEMASVESILLRQIAIPNLDVIITLHEAAEELPESTDEHPSFTGKITVYPVRYKNVLQYFSEVWRVSREMNPIPQIQVIPSYNFTTCATNLNMPQAEIDQPDISYLIQKAISKGFIKEAKNQLQLK